MALPEQVQLDQITMTEPAANAVRDLMTRRNLEGYALRVFVSGGGCSGMQYGMALEGNTRPQDMVFEAHGVKVVIDEVSINYLRGATVDYTEEMMGGGFKIHNPNAVSSCGCGQSFQTAGGEGGSGGCGSCH